MNANDLARCPVITAALLLNLSSSNRSSGGLILGSGHSSSSSSSFALRPQRQVICVSLDQTVPSLDSVDLLRSHHARAWSLSLEDQAALLLNKSGGGGLICRKRRRRGHFVVAGRRGSDEKGRGKRAESSRYLFQVPERPKVFALARCLRPHRRYGRRRVELFRPNPYLTACPTPPLEV